MEKEGVEKQLNHLKKATTDYSTSLIELEENKNNLIKFQIAINELQDQLHEWPKKVDESESKLEKLEREMAGQRVNYETLQFDYECVRARLAELEAGMVEKDQMNEKTVSDYGEWISDVVDEYRREVKALQCDLESMASLLDAKDKEIAGLKHSLAEQGASLQSRLIQNKTDADKIASLKEQLGQLNRRETELTTQLNEIKVKSGFNCGS